MGFCSFQFFKKTSQCHHPRGRVLGLHVFITPGALAIINQLRPPEVLD